MPGLTETAGNIDLEIFWQLASSSPGERVTAAKKLTVSLAAAAQSHEGDGPSADLLYSLKRLIRGLASSRDGAREGFCLALIQLLRTRHEIEPIEVFKQIVDLLQVPKGGTTQEEKECHFGRLFGCKALIQAELTALSDKDAKRVLKQGNHEELVAWKVQEELLRLQKLKSYLSEGCYCTLMQLLAGIPSDLFAASFAPRVEQLYAGVPVESLSPEQLDLMVRCEARLHPDRLPPVLQPSKLSLLVEPLKVRGPDGP